MSYLWTVFELCLAAANGFLFGFGMIWAWRARTDRLKWKAYAALMGIEEGAGKDFNRKMIASDQFRFTVGGHSVYIYSSNATDLTISVST